VHIPYKERRLTCGIARLVRDVRRYKCTCDVRKETEKTRDKHGPLHSEVFCTEYGTAKSLLRKVRCQDSLRPGSLIQDPAHRMPCHHEVQWATGATQQENDRSFRGSIYHGLGSSTPQASPDPQDLQKLMHSFRRSNPTHWPPPPFPCPLALAFSRSFSSQGHHPSPAPRVPWRLPLLVVMPVNPTSFPSS
jgi:hypothetical protein